MDLSEWSNETIHDNHVLHHHHQKSSLARFLYSYDSVNKVYTPILLLFGAIGNCLSVTVFCHAPSHRHLSSSYYLSALAISDIGYLINLLAVWLEDMGFRVITSELTCPLVMYLGQVTCFLSVWLTVSFTVERFFAVCYPLTRPTVCTVARAKKVITILTIISVIGFSYVWLIARVVNFPLPSPLLQEENEGQDELEIMDPQDLANASVLIPPCQSSLWHKFKTGSPSHAVGVVNGSSRTRDVGIFTHLDFILCNSSQNSTFTSTPLSPRVSVSSLTSDQLTMLNPLQNSSFEESPKNKSDGQGGSGGEMLVCYVREDYMYFSSMASHIDSILTLILPFCLISFLNIRIAICVWRLKDQRQNIVAVAKISTTSTYQHHQHQHSQQQNDHPSSSSIATNTTTCRLTVSKSSPILNGISSLGSSTNSPQIPPPPSTTPTQPSPTGGLSLSSAINSKSYRINLASSTTSLNTSSSMNVNGPSGGRLNRNHHHSSTTSASEARVTKTLLLVSSVFLILNFPAHAIRALAYIRSLWGLEMLEELQAAQAWANILFNTNFSCNFLLYCMSGRTFRKSLWSICFKTKSSSSSNRQPKNASTKRNLMMLQQNNRSNHHRQPPPPLLPSQSQYNRPYSTRQEEEEERQIIIITSDPPNQNDPLNNIPQPFCTSP